MDSHCARDPREVTVADRKKALRELRKRAKHLDRKWTVGFRKPDGMTILSVLPFVGSAMSTTLAVGYLRRINGTFYLSEEAESEMRNHIAKNTVMAAIPLVGWVLRRGYGVNKRNYKTLEKYVMSMPIREPPQRRNNDSARHRHTPSNLLLSQDSGVGSGISSA
ncbi:hypothetical protein GGH91_002028 [Coemansia sp. RSA 2671]|nr:hypothetical protein LPJ60_004369 [Coemansia sp. RSA 2675]KAJ2346941.1 hypothetical protein GGH91_002028 [Coemansia sp. RSA 2671]KAJ2698412.1 hypothetical protein H4218_003326 [Coemansia sp. IMI 209128]